MRLVKCIYCKEKSPKSEMGFEEKQGFVKTKDPFGIEIKKPKITRKYYHPSCLELHIKNKKEEERLFTYLIELHDLIELPKDIIVFLRKFKSEKKIDFDLIYRSYKLSEEQILYWLKNKEFTSINGMLKYTFTIARNNLNKAYKEKINEIKKQREKELVSNNMEQFIDIDLNYQKRDNGVDISNFLEE